MTKTQIEQPTESPTEASFGYSFPAIRGIQAKREYYVSMCPVRLIPKIFLFNSKELEPDMRAQRRLNRSRLPDITNYIVRNPDNYVLSAITASIDGKVRFTPLSSNGNGDKIGTLNIDMDAKFIINDGQHRRAAIERALEDHPELGNETIAVVFFLDPNLARCQQMFADLNRYAIRPSSSLGILYDQRDTQALLTKRLMNESKMYKGLVELEKTSLAARARKLFTLSAMYGATNEFLAGLDDTKPEELVTMAGDFWDLLAASFKEWQHVYNGKMTAGDIRQEYIHTHGVVLDALGRSGNSLLLKHPRVWKKRLSKVSTIDWKRCNPEWEGRAIIGGRISKGQQNVLLTTSLIKQKLKIPLSAEEMRAEEAYKLGEQ